MISHSYTKNCLISFTTRFYHYSSFGSPNISLNIFLPSDHHIVNMDGGWMTSLITYLGTVYRIIWFNFFQPPRWMWSHPFTNNSVVCRTCRHFRAKTLGASLSSSSRSLIISLNNISQFQLTVVEIVSRYVSISTLPFFSVLLTIAYLLRQKSSKRPKKLYEPITVRRIKKRTLEMYMFGLILTTNKNLIWASSSTI